MIFAEFTLQKMIFFLNNNTIMVSLDVHSTMQVPTFQSDLLGAPVEELTHAATAYLDVGLTFVPRLRRRHQPADLSNGPLYSSDLLDLLPLN